MAEASSPQRFRDSDDSWGCPCSCSGVAFFLLAVGVLAAIATPGFRSPVRAHARERACYANLRVLQSAIELYNLDFASQPVLYRGQSAPTGRLLSSQHLRSNPVCPEGPGTAYLLQPDPGRAPPLGGDLSDPVAIAPPAQAQAASEGIVYCPIHGTVD